MSERNVEFAVVTSTGEKPDAVIHVAAFDEGDGLGVHSCTNGGMRDLVRMLDALVGHIAKEVLEKDSAIAAAALVNIIDNTLAGAVGEEAMKIARDMKERTSTPNGKIKILQELLKMAMADLEEAKGED